MLIVTKSTGDKIIDLFLYFIMFVIMLITLYPFWTQVVISLDGGGTAGSAYSTGIVLFPSKFTLSSYKLAFQYDALWSGYLHTIYRTVLGVLLSVTFTAITAYPLAKRQLPGNRIFTGIILFTMLFGGGLIPSYLLIQELGLYNTIWALVIPGMIGAFNVMIVRNFFRNIPDELEESAVVDGAGYGAIFIRIVLPLSKPVLATIALWVGVGHWNAWFDSMIYIADPSRQVLQVVLRKIILENNTSDLSIIMQTMNQQSEFTGRQLQSTIIMFSIIPMLIVYPFVQKYFVKGVMVGAVKG
ncbi:carbohydrate ABC transporter permease [Paenibacillus sp. 1001270B_150601_E10]|uniref:carbohydrate ABC transporter permease n=1 Tax=Paenibacillus sp. 1001270B_150601_E10 TaxID=2787079 RepID=UPI00189D48E1|nr:carbohydrate ABC transporter permease [Paenibacillus sp. 1001270B_150601_E10]